MDNLVDLVYHTIHDYYRIHRSDYIERVRSSILWLHLVTLYKKELGDLGYDEKSVFSPKLMDDEMVRLGCLATSSLIGMDWEEDEDGGSYYYWIDLII